MASTGPPFLLAPQTQRSLCSELPPRSQEGPLHVSPQPQRAHSPFRSQSLRPGLLTLGRRVCWSALPAITKHHRQNDLNNRSLPSPSSGGQKSELKVSAGLVPSETSLLGL